LADAQRHPTPPADRPTLRDLGDFTVRSVRYMSAEQGSKMIKVRLIPESLGELRLEVTSLEHSVRVRLTSANQVVRHVLEGQLSGLREALARDGIELAELTVACEASADQTSPGYGHRRPSHFTHAARTQSSHTTSYRVPQREPNGPTHYAAAHQGSFDVFA
jgi:flagellar hook-length control protein FliK